MIYDDWVPAAGSGEPPDLPVAHPVLRSLFQRRGVQDADSFRRFITPSIEDLHDPAGIHGMEPACQRILRAVAAGETILIYGDYDVDGVTSIVLLRTVLRALGAQVEFVIPQRLVDGYGLKTEVLERVLQKREVGLIITVDCGISSIEPVRQALDRGIDVIITDHHLPPDLLPAAVAVLNPKQPGCAYPFKELAGVGVAFKLCCALLRAAGKRMSVESLLKIAAIGTVADVAPLVGENRAIARLGLDGLAETRNPGLRVLLRRLGILGRPLRAADVGFKIGPRINAAGRLALADTAIELFNAVDEESAWPVCAELERMNAERQAIEAEVRAKASAQIQGGERVLVLAGEGWHKGVLGLTAGRLAQEHHRPALVISIDGAHCVGSARSIPTVNLHEQLSEVSALFRHFGGHDFACGFSMDATSLPRLRRELQRRFDLLDESVFRRRAVIDGTVTLRELDRDFVSSHELLQPFGAGNDQPLFLIRAARVVGRRNFAEDCLELSIDDGSAQSTAVIWPSAKKLWPGINGHPLDLLARLEPDPWSVSGGRLAVADLRPAE